MTLNPFANLRDWLQKRFEALHGRITTTELILLARFEGMQDELSRQLSDIKQQNQNIMDGITGLKAALEQLKTESGETKSLVVPYYPMLNKIGSFCGLCDSSTEHAHPQSKCLDCGTVGLAENMSHHKCGAASQASHR